VTRGVAIDRAGAGLLWGMRIDAVTFLKIATKCRYRTTDLWDFCNGRKIF
jgi:hypothetical protein